jgi:hypothetical protein
MLMKEAEWMGNALARLDNAEVSPLLNLGSSTEAFRTRTQPWIDRCIFAPARARDTAIVHMDMKHAPGVDFVGDLLNDATAARLQSMRFRSMLCSNLLEHVEDREKVCALIEDLLPSGGMILVSCPYRYPLHPDPIDTGYRPTPEEIAILFKRSRLVAGEILDCGTYLRRLAGNPGVMARLFVRLLLPVYKPAAWWATVRTQSWLFRTLRVSCVVLRKT